MMPVTKKNTLQTELTLGSGNVFRDLEVKNPCTVALRTEMALALLKILTKLDNYKSFSTRLEGYQDKLKRFVNGNMNVFNLEELLFILNKTGKTVKVVIEE